MFNTLSFFKVINYNSGRKNNGFQFKSKIYYELIFDLFFGMKIFDQEICDFIKNMFACITTINPMIFVGINHQIKLLVGFNKGFN